MVTYLRLCFDLLDGEKRVPLCVLERDEHVKKVLQLLPVAGLPLPPPLINDRVVQPVHRRVGLHHKLFVSVEVEAAQPWEVVGDAERVEEP